MMPMTTRFDVWDPIRELGALHREIDRVLGANRGTANAFPAVNAWSDEDSTVVRAEIPGVDPKSISVSVQGNLLTLSGERKEQELDADQQYHRRERGYGTFSRTIRLPYEIKEGKVAANYAKGILRVELPRSESSKPRKIAVEGE